MAYYLTINTFLLTPQLYVLYSSTVMMNHNRYLHLHVYIGSGSLNVNVAMEVLLYKGARTGVIRQQLALSRIFNTMISRDTVCIVFT